MHAKAYASQRDLPKLATAFAGVGPFEVGLSASVFVPASKMGLCQPARDSKTEHGAMPGVVQNLILAGPVRWV